MKRTSMLIAALIAAAALLCTACTGDNALTPSPATSPLISPDMTAGTSPDSGILGGTPSASAGVSPDVDSSPAEDNNGIIGEPDGLDGFEEGKTVDTSTVPDISDAITTKYSGATIKSISYVTYMGEQMYLVTLEGAEDNTDTVYVKSDGTIVPYEASSGANTNSGT